MILKRNDIKLLQACLKSNGGGVAAYDVWVSVQKRLLDAKLLKRKPGESWMLIITKEGRAALASLSVLEEPK